MQTYLSNNCNNTICFTLCSPPAMAAARARNSLSPPPPPPPLSCRPSLSIPVPPLPSSPLPSLAAPPRPTAVRVHCDQTIRGRCRCHQPTPMPPIAVAVAYYCSLCCRFLMLSLLLPKTGVVVAVKIIVIALVGRQIASKIPNVCRVLFDRRTSAALPLFNVLT